MTGIRQHSPPFRVRQDQCLVRGPCRRPRPSPGIRRAGAHGGYIGLEPGKDPVVSGSHVSWTMTSFSVAAQQQRRCGLPIASLFGEDRLRHVNAGKLIRCRAPLSEIADQPIRHVRLSQRKHMPALNEFLVLPGRHLSSSTSTISRVGRFVSRVQATRFGHECEPNPAGLLSRGRRPIHGSWTAWLRQRSFAAQASLQPKSPRRSSNRQNRRRLPPSHPIH